MIPSSTSFPEILYPRRPSDRANSGLFWGLEADGVPDTSEDARVSIPGGQKAREENTQDEDVHRRR